MAKNLSQQLRFFVAMIYVVIITVIFVSFGGTITEIVDNTSNVGIWFCSGALLIIFGIYITEPFYNRPVDTITNSIAVLLALLAIPDKKALFGYWIILCFNMLLFTLSLLTIFLKDSNSRFIKVIYFIIKSIGNARIVFSPLYLATAYSFFALNQKHTEFTLVVLLWICLCVFDPIAWIVNKLTQIRKIENGESNFLGYATQCNSSEIYTVESRYENNATIENGNVVAIRLSPQNYKLGVVSWIQDLLSGRFIEIQCFDFGIVTNLFKPAKLGISTSKFTFRDRGDSEVIVLDIAKIDEPIQQLIVTNPLHIDICNFIGRVLSGSNIEIIKFSINNPLMLISEGQIIFTQIHNEKVLFQIVNGITAEEIHDSNNHSTYLCGYARKLGKYEALQLNVVKWVPPAGQPVFLLQPQANENAALKRIALSSIGRLPQTHMRIPISDINGLITHNTAILGILGVGKSCLAFEIIQKVVRANKKVVCLDITNQYASERGLYQYLEQDEIVHDFEDAELTELRQTYNRQGDPERRSSWGNVENYKLMTTALLTRFLDSRSHVLIVNPDRHYVGKATKEFKIQEVTQLSLAEKTRIISEQLLRLLMSQGQSTDAKCLVVYEEAHSLVPEWNSTANESDNTAVNGASKVIMQGRKYGLGCMVITQRTANVSKSILNQCNTVFALRIFDDTGKTFLENYIGSYYSSILPTLEERHAIAIGKGLSLKQPVIIQLNDLEHLIINQPPNT